MSKKVSVGSDTGLWLRSGDLYINIKTVMPDRSLLNLTVYSLVDGELEYTMIAKQARQVGGDKWLLKDVTYTELAMT